MPAARDAAIVAGLRRRLATADAVTLTNFAWFAARRGSAAVALEAVERAMLLDDPPSAARWAVERLSAGRLDGLLLVPLGDQAMLPAHPMPTPHHPRETVTLELLQDGRRLLANGRLSEALRNFERLLLMRPADTAALFHRGVVLAKLRRYAEALRDWESVGRADPDGRLGAVSRRHARSARELATLFSTR